MLSTFKSFDFGIPLETFRRNLPHWKQEGTTYFITFRLADSIPGERINSWKYERAKWVEQHTHPYSDSEWDEYNSLFTQRINDYLDLGHGSCILKDRRLSQIVVDSLKHFDGIRYALGEWVVMPNHVHMILQPFPDYDLSEIMRSIKLYTAHIINKNLGVSGTVWQDESFDHIIRNAKQKNRIEQLNFTYNF